MMGLHLFFKSRFDQVTPLTVPHGEYFVESFDWKAIGGPGQATINIKGDPELLKEWWGLLGTGIEIRDDAGNPLWWGLVSTAKVRPHTIWFGVSLDNMANSTAVTYSAGNSSDTSAYTTDATSLSYYGFTKQRLESLQKISDATEAAQRQQVLLNNLRYANRIVERGGGEAHSAVLQCIGYYDTLAWKNYTSSQTILTSLPDPLPVGWDWMANRIRFGTWHTNPILRGIGHPVLTGSSSFYLASIGVYVGGVGPPPGGCQISLYEYVNAFNPQAGALIAQTANWLVGTADQTVQPLTTRPLLAANTRYWIFLDGGPEQIGNDRMWVMGLDPNGAGGDRWLDGTNGNWMDPSGGNQGWTNTATMLCWLYGTQENARQITDILTNVNQFIVGTDIQSSSGLVANQAQDGTRTAKDIIEELLKNGTTNLRRLLAYVTRERVLKIYEEPVESRDSATLRLNKEGIFTDRVGNPIVHAPVGQWCMASDFVVPKGLIVDPTLFFVESATWQNGAWDFGVRDAPNPWTFAQVLNE